MGWEGILGGILSGVGGGFSGLNQGLAENEKRRQFDERLAVEKARLASEDAARNTDLSSLATVLGIQLPPGTPAKVPTVATDAVLKMVVDRQKQAESMKRQAGMADMILGMYPPDVQGPTNTPSGEPLPSNVPQNAALAAGLLRQGLGGDKPIDLVTSLTPNIKMETVRDAQGRTWNQPTDTKTGQPVGTRWPANEMEDPGIQLMRNMGLLPPLPGGGPGAPQQATAPGTTPVPSGPGDTSGAPVTGVPIPASTAPPTGPPGAPPGGPLGAPSAVAPPSGASPQRSLRDLYGPPTISMEGGKSTVQFKPQNVSNEYEFAALMASKNRTMDLTALSPQERQEAQRLVQQGQTRNPDWLAAQMELSGDPAQMALAKRWKEINVGRETATAIATAQARREQEPLPQGTSDAIATASKILSGIQRLKSFDPAAIAPYVGMLNRPLADWKQKAAGLGLTDVDKVYAAYQPIMKQLQDAAFIEGGKNLTALEQNIVYGFTPTGEEPNIEILKEKVKNLELFTTAMRDTRLKLAQEGRANISPDVYDKIITQKMVEMGIPLPKAHPSWGGGAAKPSPTAPAAGAGLVAPPAAAGADIVGPAWLHPELGGTGLTNPPGLDISKLAPPPPGKIGVLFPNGQYGHMDARAPIPRGAMRITFPNDQARRGIDYPRPE